MASKKETIILEIDGTLLECSRKQLIDNSDYFKAMLTGSFRESSLDQISIEGVNLETFNKILLLLWDHSYVMEEKDLHSILELACMLQFESVKNMCESRIQAVLKPSICLKIWHTAEMLQVSPLWQKAKSMALEDFMDIWKTSDVLKLSLDEICCYLGHIYLNANNEMIVFQTAMNWWYENGGSIPEEATKVILRLLNCVDYSSLEDIYIKEMQSYPDIKENMEIQSILDCVIDLKINGINVGEFSAKQLKFGIHFCNSKRRRRLELPTILFQRDYTEPIVNKRHKLDEPEEELLVRDNYQRKRYSFRVTANTPMKVNTNSVALSYDPGTEKFLIPSFVIEERKIKELRGFKILSNKEFIYFFGGEFVIGSRNFNRNLWRYDSFKENWIWKSRLPYDRRNFESVLVKDCIFIVGGVALYRVLQGNMFWYDMSTGKWSNMVALPNQDRFFRCCSFMDQLCIVYLIGKCVYFFDIAQNSWNPVKMFIEDHIVSEMRHFAVCSISKQLYIKGKYLIQLRFTGNSLILVKQTEMKEIDYEEMDSCLCNDTIYTLYSHRDDDYDILYTLESLNLHSGEKKYIFKNKIKDKPAVSVDNKFFRPSEYTKLFSINYYGLVKENIDVNDPIINCDNQI